MNLDFNIVASVAVGLFFGNLLWVLAGQVLSLLGIGGSSKAIEQGGCAKAAPLKIVTK